MANITASMTKLAQKLPCIAGSSGDPNVLATQEIKFAYQRGKLNLAERDVLARAASDAGNSTGGLTLENYRRWMFGFYRKAFAAADTNGSGRLSQAEIAAVKEAGDTVTVKTAKGQRTLFCASSLLQKLADLDANS